MEEEVNENGSISICLCDFFVFVFGFVFVFANPKHITAIHPMHILDVDMMRSQ